MINIFKIPQPLFLEWVQNATMVVPLYCITYISSHYFSVFYWILKTHNLCRSSMFKGLYVVVWRPDTTAIEQFHGIRNFVSFRLRSFCKAMERGGQGVRCPDTLGNEHWHWHTLALLALVLHSLWFCKEQTPPKVRTFVTARSQPGLQISLSKATYASWDGWRGKKAEIAAARMWEKSRKQIQKIMAKLSFWNKIQLRATQFRGDVTTSIGTDCGRVDPRFAFGGLHYLKRRFKIRPETKSRNQQEIQQKLQHQFNNKGKPENGKRKIKALGVVVALCFPHCRVVATSGLPN